MAWRRLIGLCEAFGKFKSYIAAAIAIAAIALSILLVYKIEWFESIPAFLPWIDTKGIGSGVTVGFLGGMLFLAIAMWLDASNEKRVDDIHSYITEKFRVESINGKYESFRRIFFDEVYYDIWLDPDKYDGLHYRVFPVSKDGQRVVVRHLHDELLLVRLKLPAHFEPRSKRSQKLLR